MKTTVELIPTSSQTFTYHKPMQLDDGFKTAGLSDAGLDTYKMGDLHYNDIFRSQGYKQNQQLYLQNFHLADHSLQE